jgi:hypothetical protein
MGNGHNPRHPIPNRVYNLEMVLRSGTKFAVVGITFQRVSVGMVPYLFKGILNFINEFSDNLGGVGPTEEKIGPAVELHIRRFDQNGFGIAHERRFVVNLRANVPAKTF